MKIKSMWAMLAVAAGVIVAAMAAWYCISGFGDSREDKEGTLVWLEQHDGDEEAMSAFVTSPDFMTMDQGL